MHIKIEFVKSPLLNKYSTFTVLLIDESDAFKTLISGHISKVYKIFHKLLS